MFLSDCLFCQFDIFAGLRMNKIVLVLIICYKIRFLDDFNLLKMMKMTAVLT